MKKTKEVDAFHEIRNRVKPWQVRISKSQYIKGLQCPKALWLYRRRPELAAPVTEAQQHLFDSGHAVEKLAWECFPGGVEVTDPYYEIDRAVESTRRMIDQGATTIYEATACSASGAYCRIDILHKEQQAEKWDLIEIKQSTSVKDYHVDDMAFQRHVFENAGYPIGDSFLMHLNKAYVRRGPLEYDKLFALENGNAAVAAKLTELPLQLALLKKMIRTSKEPDRAVGPHCSSPFECEFTHYCWQDIPETHVRRFFTGSNLEAFLGREIHDIADVPFDFAGPKRQQILLDAHKTGKPHIDPSGINVFLKTLQYPLYFLDYETIFPAVPLFDASSPYQQIPFQFSLHIQETPDGSVKHIEYLHTDPTDPRPGFAAALVDACGENGSVVVYNQGFESRINRELGALLPEYKKALDQINDRMVDLLAPFRSRVVYHPAMNGSASLKAVLPALVPELDYDGLAIADGTTASNMYLHCISGMCPEPEKKQIFADLRKYCAMDTWAEVKLLAFLYQNA